MTTQYGVEYDLEMLYSGAANLERAASDLRQFARAAEEVKQDVDNATQDATGQQSLFKRMTEGWADAKAAFDVVGGAISTVADTLEGVYDTLARGAEISKTADQFDRLAESIGASGDELLSSMTQATAGMISQTELMQAGVQMINLGLAGSAEEVGRLSGVVGQLGWDMDVLTLTLANQSFMRLDTLGLSIDTVKGKLKEFEDQGYTTEEAFKWAIIEAGEDKIKVLGDASETAAGQLAQIETAVTDMQDAFALGMAEGFFDNLDNGQDFAEAMQEGAVAAGELGESLGELMVAVMPALIKGAETLADVMSGIADVMDTQQVIDRAIQEGITTREEWQSYSNRTWNEQGKKDWEAYEKGLREAIAKSDAEAQVAKEAAEIYKAYQQAVADSLTETDDPIEGAVDETTKALVDKFWDAGGESGEAFSEHWKAQQEALNAEEAFKLDRLEEISSKMGEAAGKVYADAFAEQVSSSGDQFTQAFEAFQDPEESLDFAQMLYDSADAAGASASALGNLAIAMGDLTEEEAKAVIQQAFLIESMENLGRAIAEGAITPEEAFEIGAEMIRNVQEGIDVTAGDLIFTLDPEVKIENEAKERAADQIQADLEAEFASGTFKVPISAEGTATTIPEVKEEMMAETMKNAISSVPLEDRTVEIELEITDEVITAVIGEEGIGQITDPDGGSHIAPVTISEEWFTTEIPSAIGAEGMGQLVDTDWLVPVSIDPAFDGEISAANQKLNDLVAERTASIKVTVYEERQPVDAGNAT